jgi:hypothetical protein
VRKRFDNELPDGTTALALFPNGINVRVVARGGSWTENGRPLDVTGAVLEILSTAFPLGTREIR